MSPALIFGSAFVIGLSGAVMPGPFLTVTIVQCLTRGWRAALWLVTGHALLELTLVLLLLLGLNRVVGHPTVLRTMAMAGGGVLLWMGAGAFRSAAHQSAGLVASVTADAGDPPRTQSGILTLVVSGAAVSLANPYWVVWWATIGVFYLLGAQEHGPGGVPAFFAGHITSDYAWYVSIGLLLAFGRRWLGPRPMRILFSLCGIVLGGFGVLFLLMGLGMVGSLTTMAMPAAG